jgi:hypothetical protein
VVADHAHDHEGRALEDGDSLDHLLLVSLGASLVHITQDVGGTGLVAHEGGKVAGGAGVIKGERLDVALSLGAALLGEEPEGTVTGALKLAVRHLGL